MRVRGAGQGSGGITFLSSNEYKRFKPPQTKADCRSDCAYTNIQNLKRTQMLNFSIAFWWAGSKCLAGILVF